MYAPSRNRRWFDRYKPVELSLERTPLGDTSLHFRIRPSALVALVAALLLHGLAVYFAMSTRKEPEQPLGASGEPISARLIEPEAPARAQPQPPAAQPAPAPQKPRARPRDKTRRDVPRKPAAAPPEVIRAPEPLPAPATRPPKPAADAPTDMMSFVNAQRERRRLAEEADGRENAEAAARERGPSADEVAAATIKRNLQAPGTNGVFQITRKSVRTAAFVFRGWTTDAGNAKREFIEVDAGLNGDIERAVAQKMIELIRRYYTGNFNWESRRLGRTVVKSARPEDSADLEDFLISEFFRVGVVYPN